MQINTFLFIFCCTTTTAQYTADLSLRCYRLKEREGSNPDTNPDTGDEVVSLGTVLEAVFVLLRGAFA